MANKYNFLPDFSMFDTADQNDATTEDTSSSLMTRSSKADADPAAGREEFLKSFYDNLRSSFETEDVFRKTFPPRKRPKPNQSEIEDYINKSRTKMGIDDALFEATGMYSTGTPSDDNTMTIQDASDGITVPKQPNVMVDELSSDAGSYLRNRANKGASFVGDGVQMASAGSLSVEDMDLARMLAGQTMRKEAAEMGLPVVDMEEEAKKSAVEAARERAKKGITQSKGAPQGIMSPKAVAEEEVEAAEETTPVVEPEVETVEETTAGKAPSIAYVNPETSTKGETERKVYQYAYEQGLQGDELRAFMAQTAKESASFGDIKENGYLKTKVDGSWVERTPAQIAAKLGGSAERKAAFNALANNKAFTEGTDAQKNKMIFDIYYDDQYRGEGYKLGNTEAGDGSKYRGRGYIQLTGRNNYRDIGKDIGLDLVANPDLMLDPEIAKKASVAWWKRNVRSKDPNYTDTKEVTKLVNGGDTGLADRRKLFNTYKFAVGPQTSLRPSARPDTRVAAN